MTSTSKQPEPSGAIYARNIRPACAVGLFSMGQAELLTLIVPLWALLQGAQPAEIGALVSARSALTFFLAIHGGALMDRLGTRRVLMFFALLTAGLAAAYPLLPWLPVMIALQMLIGFAANMSWIGAQTIIAQISGGDPGRIGTFSFFARIGTITAPILMGLLWDHAGPVLSFLGITLWSSCLFVAVTRLERPPAAAHYAGRLRWRDALPRLSDYTGSLQLIVIPAVLFTLAISAMRHAMNAAESSFFIVYLRDIGYAGTTIGAIFSIAEVCNGLGSLASGRIAKFAPIPWLMAGFTALSVATLGLTPFLGGAFALLAATHALRRTCEGIVQPFMFSLQARAVPRDKQGAMVGLRVTNNRLSSIVTPLAMGAIVQFAGLDYGFVITSALLLAACAGLGFAILRTPVLRSGQTDYERPQR
ncbi:MAG: MFS transporter [Beijerinckiaceae bacterium]